MPVILNQPINTNLQEGLILDQNDKNVLYCMGAYILIILILWDLPFLKSLLYPFKLVVTVFHEMGHATMCKLTGGKVVSIQIDADTGGVTEMIGGNQYVTLVFN